MTERRGGDNRPRVPTGAYVQGASCEQEPSVHRDLHTPSEPSARR
jgi:hypothetical protein